MVSALSVFLASLLGIVTLFGFKAWEMRREHVVAEQFRARLDEGAIALKRQLEDFERILARLPSLLNLSALKGLEFMTVTFAEWARGTSEAAHRLADFISHKHNFERREIRSEFLKTMIEHKNGLAQPLSIIKKKNRTTEKVSTTENVTAPGAQEVH